MPTYEAWVPTWAGVRWELETPEPIADPDELRRLMLETGEPQGNLCHQCADDVEMDPANYDEEQAKRIEVTEKDA